MNNVARTHAWRWIIVVSFIFIVVLLNWLGGTRVTFALMQQYAHSLKNMVNQHYLFSVFVYLFVFVAATFFLVPITILLTILAGFLFGVALGTIYAIIGATVGGVLIFLSVRYVIGDVVQKRYERQLALLNRELRNYGVWYLLMLQIMPLTPTPMLNTIAGVTRIAFGTYLWTTVVGLLPGSLVYAFAGKSLSEVHSLSDVLTASLFIALTLLGLLSLLPIIVARVRQKR